MAGTDLRVLEVDDVLRVELEGPALEDLVRHVQLCPRRDEPRRDEEAGAWKEGQSSGLLSKIDGEGFDRRTPAEGSRRR